MKMLYKNKFTLLGTEQQIAIVASALDRIMFPWEKLTAPNKTFLIGWADLNSGMYNAYAKHHRGRNPNDPFAIEKEIGGRNYILGIFYPSSGNSWIDYALINHPDIARTTVSAELAHLVDFFLPLTPQQKRSLVALAHGDLPTDHSPDEWWEVHDYGKEYNGLVGESWMEGFTYAYSDMYFDGSQFSHRFTRSHAQQIRQVLGIPRTDHVLEPVLTYYDHFVGSDVYHTLDHYKRLDDDIETIASNDPVLGTLRPCRICRPDKNS